MKRSTKRLLAEHTLGKHQNPRMSFVDALEGYLAAKEQTNRPRTMKDTRRILNKHFTSIKRKNLDD